MPTTKHRIAANLTEPEFDELAAMAEKYDVSLSWLSRKAVLEFIDRYRVEQLQLPLRLEPQPPPRISTNLTRNVNA
jgi:hypothetical protein